MLIENVFNERQEVLKEVKNIVSRNPSTVITHAIVKYNLEKGIPNIFDYSDYPLQLIGKISNKAGIKIRILNITAGDKNENSELLKEILEYFEFEFNEEEIFTTVKQNDCHIIKLTYVKRDSQ